MSSSASSSSLHHNWNFKCHLFFIIFFELLNNWKIKPGALILKKLLFLLCLVFSLLYVFFFLFFPLQSIFFSTYLFLYYAYFPICYFYSSNYDSFILFPWYVLKTLPFLIVKIFFFFFYSDFNIIFIYPFLLSCFLSFPCLYFLQFVV